MSIWGSRFTAGIATVVLAAVSAGGPAGQTLAPPLSDLVARADRVVVSEVVEVRSELRQTRDGEIPVTLVVLGVDRTLKGAPSVQLLLEFPGGEAPGASGNEPKERLEIVGMPSFRAGDRDVLFLSAPGSLSPLIGLSHGRYRVQADGAGNLVVAGADGRAVLSEDGHPISLKAFEALVGRMASGIAKPVDSNLPSPRGEEIAAMRVGSADRTGLAPVGSLWSAPLAPRIALGASPALLNGCRDWTCVVARALEPFGSPSPASPMATENDKDTGRTSRAIEQEHVGLHILWATDVFGRTMDELTPVVTVRREINAQRTVTVLLNRSLAWNAYDGLARSDEAGRPLLDLERVLVAELRQVFEFAPAAAAQATANTTSGQGSMSAPRSDTSRVRPSASRRVPGVEEAGVNVRALAPCDPDSGVLINPRMLTFQSPDDWAMSGYQVGFFREGASSAERTVDLGREAFLIRRVVDLPSNVATTMQQSFVTMIRTAGLTTPNGVVYRYRVRGIWAGGTTAWSEPSEPFVTCPG